MKGSTTKQASGANRIVKPQPDVNLTQHVEKNVGDGLINMNSASTKNAFCTRTCGKILKNLLIHRKITVNTDA